MTAYETPACSLPDECLGNIMRFDESIRGNCTECGLFLLTGNRHKLGWTLIEESYYCHICLSKHWESFVKQGLLDFDRFVFKKLDEAETIDREVFEAFKSKYGCRVFDYGKFQGESYDELIQKRWYIQYWYKNVVEDTSIVFRSVRSMRFQEAIEDLLEYDRRVSRYTKKLSKGF